MEQVQNAYDALDNLCNSIRSFIITGQQSSTYRAPIIDHFHPDDYCQKTIAGLSRFSSHCQSERDYVEGILKSGVPINDFTTNAPNLLAVWDEFVTSPRPLLLIAQMLDVEGHGQVKLDAIVDGGNEWIKVSTIRETRLLAEFREQDSYINSDYDTDSDLDEESPGPSGTSTPNTKDRSPPPLTNSLITQAKSLVAASNAFKRPAGLPQPRIRFVLNRMDDAVTYSDPRIEETFGIIRDMGIDLVLGKQPRLAMKEYRYREPTPARNILLDLSVLVALCCDSAHHPLPTNEFELESRFRALAGSCDKTTDRDELSLTAHSNVTRDLRDQLKWEMQHSLVGELQARISHDSTDHEEKVKFWVTEEVKGRLPNIIDTIGGPREKARADALFGVGEHDYWENSRWKGKAPALGNMRLGLLPTEDQADNLDLTELEISLDSTTIPTFNQRLVRACHHLLQPPESGSITPPAPLHRQKYRRSRNYKRPQAIFPSTRLPSQHTLNSFSAGAKRGWTVLTNNRGAVGKVMRDMGVKDGLPFDKELEGGGTVSIWVVNPSSLSEWRRLEVEESNRTLLARQIEDPH